MTERLSRPEGGAARVGIIALASAGWGDIRGSFARLWPVWLGWAVFSGAAQYVGHQLIKPGASALSLTPELFAYEAASSVGMAVFTGLTLRGFLAPATPLWRLNRGFFAYVALVSLVSVLTLVAASLQPTPPAAGTAVEGSVLAMALVVVILFPLATWVAIRLLLWPVALLIGDGAVTVREAWGRMRGVVWPYIAACFVLGALPFLVSLVFSSQYFLHGQIAALILGQPFTIFYRLTGVAVAAASYRARAGA